MLFMQHWGWSFAILFMHSGVKNQQGCHIDLAEYFGSFARVWSEKNCLNPNVLRIDINFSLCSLKGKQYNSGANPNYPPPTLHTTLYRF